MVAAQALKAAGPGASPDALRAALAKSEYTGPQGLVKFDANGESSVAAHVLTFKSGAYHFVR
jgi:ABC-type branched-subunit amino acid transport system substrate-binding protein